MSRPAPLRSILGCAAGNRVEWFDWYVYSAFSLYFAKAFFPGQDQTGAGVQTHRALQKLDPVVADALFIERLLPGATVEKPLDLAGSKAGVTLRMRAVPLDQLIHVAELGQVLPAGSTAFHPPLLPSLLSAPIEPDEDLAMLAHHRCDARDDLVVARIDHALHGAPTDVHQSGVDCAGQVVTCRGKGCGQDQPQLVQSLGDHGGSLVARRESSETVGDLKS